jgi:hypothetical protein
MSTNKIIQKNIENLIEEIYQYRAITKEIPNMSFCCDINAHTQLNNIIDKLVEQKKEFTLNDILNNFNKKFPNPLINDIDLIPEISNFINLIPNNKEIIHDIINQYEHLIDKSIPLSFILLAIEKVNTTNTTAQKINEYILGEIKNKYSDIYYAAMQETQIVKQMHSIKEVTIDNNKDIYNQIDSEELIKYHIEKIFQYSTQFEEIFYTN